MSGQRTTSTSTSINNNQRYYIDVKADRYQSTDKVTLYYNTPGNRDHEVKVSDKIQKVSNQTYDYLIQIY